MSDDPRHDEYVRLETECDVLRRAIASALKALHKGDTAAAKAILLKHQRPTASKMGN